MQLTECSTGSIMTSIEQRQTPNKKECYYFSKEGHIRDIQRYCSLILRSVSLEKRGVNAAVRQSLENEEEQQ